MIKAGEFLAKVIYRLAEVLYRWAVLVMPRQGSKNIDRKGDEGPLGSPGADYRKEDDDPDYHNLGEKPW